MNSNDMEIRSMSFEECWNTFKTEISMFEDSYRKVRFGIQIKFDINDYIKGRIVIKPKVGKAYIRTEAFSLIDFETELELRERQMKDWLLDNFAEKEVATPRGILYE